MKFTARNRALALIFPNGRSELSFNPYSTINTCF